MAKIAILGFGTVGSGVYEVLCRNAAGVSRRAGEPVEVKYILDPKDFSAHPAANLFIKNFDAILEDPEIRVLVEPIGGTRFAYPYVKACLESGRDVYKRQDVSFSAEYFSTLVGEATKQCYGVAAMTPRDLTDAVKKMCIRDRGRVLWYNRKGIGILIIQLPTPCVQHNFQRAGNVSRFAFLLYHKTLPCARFSCMFCKKAGRDCE